MIESAGAPAAWALRPIESRDDGAMAAIIRTVMTSFGAVGPGYAIVDPEVDAMSAAYAGDGAGFFVVDAGDRIVGGAGFARLAGAEPSVCELRKMYFLPEARGRGVGAKLLDLVLAAARDAGYRRMYLETLASMHAAQRLYESRSFARLDAPLGDTGHHGCDVWYARDL